MSDEAPVQKPATWLLVADRYMAEIAEAERLEALAELMAPLAPKRRGERAAGRRAMVAQFARSASRNRYAAVLTH